MIKKIIFFLSISQIALAQITKTQLVLATGLQFKPVATYQGFYNIPVAPDYIFSSGVNIYDKYKPNALLSFNLRHYIKKIYFQYGIDYSTSKYTREYSQNKKVYVTETGKFREIQLPISVAYQVLNKNKFSIYVPASVIPGLILSSDIFEQETPLTFNIQLATNLQYQITKKTSVNLEPFIQKSIVSPNVILPPLYNGIFTDDSGVTNTYHYDRAVTPLNSKKVNYGVKLALSFKI